MRYLYLPLADSAFIYDNSDGLGILIAEKREGAAFVVHNGDRWNQILEATQ